MKKTDGDQHQSVIPLTALSPQQLQELKNSLEVEIQALSQHVVELRYAQKKFEESKTALNSMGHKAEGKAALIPLTQSVYVPAKLIETESVLLDIGTNYHAKRTIQQAKTHCESKIHLTEDNCTKALKIIADKKTFIEALNMQMQKTK